VCVCACIEFDSWKGKFERWRVNHRVGFRVRGKLRREKRLDRLGEQGTDTKGERDSWPEGRTNNGRTGQSVNGEGSACGSRLIEKERAPGLSRRK
jgi:hypothetical protein